MMQKIISPGSVPAFHGELVGTNNKFKLIFENNIEGKTECMVAECGLNTSELGGIKN